MRDESTITLRCLPSRARGVGLLTTLVRLPPSSIGSTDAASSQFNTLTSQPSRLPRVGYRLWDHDNSVAAPSAHFVFPSFVIKCDDSNVALETMLTVEGQRDEYNRSTHFDSRLARKLVRPGLGDGLAMRPEEAEHYSTQYNRRDGWSRLVIGVGVAFAAGTLLRLKSVGSL